MNYKLTYKDKFTQQQGITTINAASHSQALVAFKKDLYYQTKTVTNIQEIEEQQHA